MKNKILNLSTLKKRFVKAKKSLITCCALTLGALSCSSFLSLYSKSVSYAKVPQIEDIAEDLGADLTPCTFNDDQQIRRLKHNNGNPIYVSLLGTHTLKQRACITRSLENIFGVLSEINPLYYYKIVSPKEAAQMSLGGQTVIYYTNVYEPNRNANAHVKINSPISPKLKKDNLYRTFIICYNSAKYDKSNMQNVYNHELMHTMGINDVYDDNEYRYIDKYYGSTIVNVSDFDNLIHPNDVKVLASLYFPPLYEKSLDKYYNKIETVLNQYEETYYKTIAKQLISSLSTQSIDRIETFPRIRTSFKQSEAIDSVIYTCNYHVTLENGKYTFTVKDESNTKVLDYCEGEAYLIDSVIFLRDVELTKGYDLLIDSECPDGYINDLAFLKNIGNYYLYTDNQKGKFLSQKFIYGRDEWTGELLSEEMEK